MFLLNFGNQLPSDAALHFKRMGSSNEMLYSLVPVPELYLVPTFGTFKNLLSEIVNCAVHLLPLQWRDRYGAHFNSDGVKSVLSVGACTMGGSLHTDGMKTDCN
jgi:hypothetical protein